MVGLTALPIPLLLLESSRDSYKTRPFRAENSPNENEGILEGWALKRTCCFHMFPEGYRWYRGYPEGKPGFEEVLERGPGWYRSLIPFSCWYHLVGWR